MVFAIIALFISVLVGLLIWLLSMPGDITASQSKLIKAKPADVFAAVVDFKRWEFWNPWTMHRPETKLTFSEHVTEVDGFYTWEDDIIGAGKLQHTAIKDAESIEQDLSFTRPQSSQSKISWNFKAVEQGTEVTWSMRGKIPLFFRFLIPSIQRGLSTDFKTGLIRLAHHVSPSQEAVFKLDFEGIYQQEPLAGLGTGSSCKLEDIPKHMSGDFQRSYEVLAQTKASLSSSPVCAFHRYDQKNNHTSFDVVLPLAESQSKVRELLTQTPEAAPLRSIEGGKYFKVIYHGAFGNLPSARASSYSHVSLMKHKVDTHRPALEIYVSDPQNTPPEKLITHFCIPVR